MSYLIGRYAFPVAVSLNFFSITFLLVIAGISGNETLAADIGVLQAAIVAVFLSLSGNARSVILSDSGCGCERNILAFRLLVMIPASFVIYTLTKGIVDVPLLLAVGLITRKSCEWVVELQLSSKEKDGDLRFASKYIYVNLFFLLLLSLSLVLSWVMAFYIVLMIWAVVPILVSAKYVQNNIDFALFRLDIKGLLPNIGSSTIIGVTTYIFRLMVLYLVGKEVAGQLFSAYAIGGLISSLYIYAFGPSILLANASTGYGKMYLFQLVWFVIGVMVLAIPVLGLSGAESSMLFYAVGISIIGGSIMLLAQRQRLYILQVCKKDVFVTDSLSNMVLILSIPLAYFMFGINALVGMFLWSSVLNCFFYFPVLYRERVAFERN